MNKGNEGSRAGSRAPGSEKVTPNQSPTLKPVAAPRASIDSRTSDTVSLSEAPAQPQEGSADNAAAELPDDQAEPTVDQPAPSDPTTIVPPIPTLELPNTISPRPSQDSALSRPSLDALSQSQASAAAEPELPAAPTPLKRTPSTVEAELARLAKEREDDDKQRREEMLTHLERIDALQAKLKALTKSAEEAAKLAKEDAAPGTLEKKLAEKDQSIVDLMREAEARSKEAFQFSETLKKIRAQNAQREKGDAELKRKSERLEKGWAEEKEGRRRAEARVKEAEEKVKIVGRIERDVDELKREKEQAQELIRDLKRQLGDAIGRAEDAEKKANEERLEQERRTVAGLKEELDNMKIEKKLAEDRLRTEVKDAKAQTVSTEERAKMTEIELRSEVTVRCTIGTIFFPLSLTSIKQNLETKLELLRSRTEEASSSATGDSQAKLLRQIETLQTQYALASENWQGIESTLNARVIALEKERDDISKREADVRKKAREVNSKSRRLEDDLESAQERTRTLEQDTAEQTAQMQKLQSRVSQAEATLNTAREQFERDKKIWDAEFQQRLEEEKTKWRLELSTAQTTIEPPYLRTDSPSHSSAQRKLSAQELNNFNARRSPNNRALSYGAEAGLNLNTSAASIQRPASRHNNSLSATFQSSGVFSPARQLSATSLHQINGSAGGFYPPTSNPLAAPSIDAIADDDFDAPATGTSSPQHRGSTTGVGTPVADLVSVSTMNAGPSVQLVERMSAAVRRLESEKASLKEEMSRLSGQRDEARSEVVKLMREADKEKGKGMEERLRDTEKELGELRERWERALEMLGERQEECEELRQDVGDLKGIIRSMAEERAQK